LNLDAPSHDISEVTLSLSPVRGFATMADAFRGLYRTVAWAYVTNGAMAFQVPEAQYRQLDYQPEYNRLPWRDDYLARPVTAASAAPVQVAPRGESLLPGL
jgi:hypothetical protein